VKLSPSATKEPMPRIMPGMSIPAILPGGLGLAAPGERLRLAAVSAPGC
jgi:hypothetical protein